MGSRVTASAQPLGAWEMRNHRGYETLFAILRSSSRSPTISINAIAAAVQVAAIAARPEPMTVRASCPYWSIALGEGVSRCWTSTIHAAELQLRVAMDSFA